MKTLRLNYNHIDMNNSLSMPKILRGGGYPLIIT